MIIIPAIDVKNGKVVRLTRGEAHRETVYSNSPIEVAEKWSSLGAQLIHVVDLDGALEGSFKNIDLIKDMVRHVKSKIELGGGIRDEAMIKSALEAGIEKVVIGTKALDEQFLFMAAKKFKGRLVVGIDAKDGIVHTKGWVFNTKMGAIDLARQIKDLGIETINYTDISKDGTLAGPDVSGIKELLDATDLNIVASGGISSIEDVKKMKSLADSHRNLVGIIIGKALYEGTIDLGEAIKICGG